MPLWLDIVIALIVVAAGARLFLVWIDREPPTPWQDPSLPERERDEDFWNRQW